MEHDISNSLQDTWILVVHFQPGQRHFLKDLNVENPLGTKGVGVPSTPRRANVAFFAGKTYDMRPNLTHTYIYIIHLCPLLGWISVSQVKRDSLQAKFLCTATQSSTPVCS